MFLFKIVLAIAMAFLIIKIGVFILKSLATPPPEPPPPGMAPSCQEAGVLGVLPGVVGVIQAIETIKLLLGVGEPLIGRLLTFDALRMTFREMRIRQDPECPMCGENPTITELIDYEQFCSL